MPSRPSEPPQQVDGAASHEPAEMSHTAAAFALVTDDDDDKSTTPAADGIAKESSNDAQMTDAPAAVSDPAQQATSASTQDSAASPAPAPSQPAAGPGTTSSAPSPSPAPAPTSAPVPPARTGTPGLKGPNGADASSRATSQQPEPSFKMPAEAAAHGAPVRQYLNKKVTATLLEGMKLVAREKPKNPLRVLGEFLIERSKVLEPDS